MDEMVAEKPEREKLILERILTLKQMLRDGTGGPVELHELGICYFHLENYRQAIHYLDDLIHLYPDYVERATVHSLRVLCLIREGEYDRAETSLLNRLKVQEQDTSLLAMLAHIHERRSDQDEAIRIHRRILELDPDNINSSNNLGSC